MTLSLLHGHLRIHTIEIQCALPPGAKVFVATLQLWGQKRSERAAHLSHHSSCRALPQIS